MFFVFIFFIFFFFFLMRNTWNFNSFEIELQQREQNNSKKNKTTNSYTPPSSIITCSTKLGHTPFQTCEIPEILAALASEWVALLPLLFKCWKEHHENKEEMSLMFCTMWPKSPPRSPSIIAWIIEKASDSTMAWEIPKSNASSTPSCSAKASVISAEKRAGRILLDAAKREPR